MIMLKIFFFSLFSTSLATAKTKQIMETLCLFTTRYISLILILKH